MDLIKQIINELIDQNISINSALLKTKVLASRISNMKLLEWVNSELSGYDSNRSLPLYRKDIKNALTGNVINGYAKLTNIQIPTDGLEENMIKSLTHCSFFQSISCLENMISEREFIAVAIPVGIRSLIERNWQDMGNPGLGIISCQKIIARPAIVEILSNVRNKLLDFMLTIENEFGINTELTALKREKAKITNIVNNTIITSNGDGNLINAGDKNDIENVSEFSKGDIEVLKNNFKRANVSETDIDEFVKILTTDNHDLKSKRIGDRTKIWISKMLNKALDGSWNIGIGAAGTLLAEGIKTYLGFR